MLSRWYVVLGLLWVGCQCEQPSEQGSVLSKPDIIIVTVDTLRADALGFNQGGAKTPALDKLASGARNFVQATTPLPRTTPALASLQTGLMPHHHGAREVGDRMDATVTLAGQLAQGGYHSAGISAMKVAGQDQALDRGFSSYEVHHDARAKDLTAAALAQVEAAPKDKPLYLWVHYADPHFPYLPEARGGEGTDQCWGLGDKAARRKLRREVLFTNRGGLADKVLDGCRQLYFGEIEAVDAAIGTLLDGVESARNNTRFVVFSADHGENLGEDALYFEHGPSLHDASLRVPMLVAGPAVEAGVDEGMATLQDLMPTLLHQVDPSLVPQGLDGRDLSKRLAGMNPDPNEVALSVAGAPLHMRLFQFPVTGRKDRWCLNQAPYSLCVRKKLGALSLHNHEKDPDLKRDISNEHPEVFSRMRVDAGSMPAEVTKARAARTSTLKLVQTPLPQGRWTTKLVSVSDESKDISAQHPQEAKRLQTMLEEWGDLVLGNKTPNGARSEQDLDALRSLGYVE